MKKTDKISEIWTAIDIIMELFCNEIHLQPNWTDSRGAKIEHRIAKFLRYDITNN